MKIKFLLYLFIILFEGCISSKDDNFQNVELILEKKYCFDTIKIGNIFQHSFIFLNSSEDTIFIDKISHSCNCVNILKEVNLILPKDKDSIIVSLTPTERGYTTRYIYVYLKDNWESPIDLILEGYVNTE